jgi:hypothetical protein
LKNPPAYELFVEQLPLDQVDHAQRADFVRASEYVEEAFGFSLMDAAAFATLLGGLAYVFEAALYIEVIDDHIVVADAAQLDPLMVSDARVEQFKAWIAYYSRSESTKIEESKTDLQTWSGHRFIAFYDYPFIEVRPGNYVSIRPEWVLNLGSVEKIFHLCRVAMDERGVDTRQWRQYYGKLLEEYVVDRLRRLPSTQELWREKQVPGLERHGGPRCDVVVESPLGYVACECKAAVPRASVATEDDSEEFDCYLRQVSVGVAGTTCKKVDDRPSPLRQIEGTASAWTIKPERNRIAISVAGSHVPLEIRHLDAIFRWWREEVGKDGGPTGLMMPGFRFLPLDLSGFTALCELCESRDVDLFDALAATYDRASRQRIPLLSPVGLVVPALGPSYRSSAEVRMYNAAAAHWPAR